MNSVGVGEMKFGRSLGVEFGECSAWASSLLLDGEGGEMAMAPPRAKGKKLSGDGVCDSRNALALKSHSEAERRRRERINSHLDKLRSMIPHTEKLDKAALLAEVINRVKELKTKASVATKGYNIPTDADEVRVEVEGDDAAKNGNFLVKASLCCEESPELITDLRQTLQSIHLRIVRAEISSFGGRIKHVIVMMPDRNSTEAERHVHVASIHQALKSVLDRVNLQVELLPSTSFPNKRRRISVFES